MDPADKATWMSRTISEALNSLGVFLCEPTLRQLQIDTPRELQRWVNEFADALRQCSAHIPAAGRVRFVRGLDGISAATGPNAAIDAQEQLAAVRSAAREVLVGLGVPLPDLPPEESAICGLHGATCPAAAPK